VNRVSRSNCWTKHGYSCSAWSN